MSTGMIRKDKQRGTWWFVVDVPGLDGKRRQIKRRGFATQGEAQDALDELRGYTRNGRAVGPHRLTFGDFLRDRWLPHLDGNARLKPTTRASYRSAAKHLIRHAGHLRLNDVRGDDLDAVQTALAGKSTSLRRAVHVCAHKALGDAVRWRLVTFNAADDATPPPQCKPNPAAWSPTDVGKFLSVAEGDRWWPLWRLAATTGMRRGELVGLRWSAVNLDRGEVTVSNNATVADGRVHQGTPKSDRTRTIRLDPRTVAVLRAWRATHAAEMLTLGEYRPDDDFVFTWPDGTTVHPNVVTRTFNRLVKRAGIPPLRLHSLRHACATNALDAGASIKDVSTRLGHSSVRITYDIYVAPSSDRDAQVASAVADLYDGARQAHAD